MSLRYQLQEISEEDWKALVAGEYSPPEGWRVVGFQLSPPFPGMRHRGELLLERDVRVWTPVPSGPVGP